MAEEIERLIVTIETDIADTLAKVDKTTKQAEGRLKGFERVGKAAFGKVRQAVVGVQNAIKKVGTGLVSLGKAAKRLTGMFTPLSAAAVGFAAIFTAKRIVSFFSDIQKAAVGLTKVQISAEKQLEAALLSTGNAVGMSAEELKKLAAELQNVTNFGDEATIQAQALLLSFTKIGRETFPLALEAIADVATAMKTDLKSATLQVGKALNDPIAGISALTRSGIQFTDAQKDLITSLVEGGKVAEAQAVILKELQTQFGGSARAAREADGGVIAFANSIGDLQEVLGKPIAEEQSRAFERLNSALSDSEMQSALNELAQTLGEVLALANKLLKSGIISSLENLDADTIIKFSAAIEDAAAALSELTGETQAADLNTLLDALTVLIDTGTIIVNTWNNVRGTFLTIKPVIDTIKDAIIQLVAPVFQLIDGFKQLNNLVEQLSGEDLADFSRDLAEATETEAQRRARIMKQYRETFQQDTGFRGATPDTDTSIINPEATEAGADRVTEIIESLSDEFIELQNETNAELEANEADHLETMASLQQEFLTDTAEATEAAGKKLLDFEDDIRKARETIFNDARESLAELSRETDQQIAREREQGNLEEARATEDHLRDMRRLRLSFLDDLEGAVASRDAGRVRDLQRQFARESQERTEDFQTEQGREGQDRSSRLAQIRASEQEQSAAILSEQNKRLEALRVLEIERRAELQENLRMELEQIRLKSEETIRKEQEEHTTRQAELNRALAERLSSLATELAAENDITAEGASAILSTYNNFFGIGGDVDKLMEEFSQRQRDRMRLSLQLPRNVGARGGGGSSRSRSPVGQVQAFAEGGSMIARKPTLALFGEKTPEMAQFTPLNKMGGGRPQQMQIEFSGSAPPGIRGGEIEQIAAIINRAFREAGA